MKILYKDLIRLLVEKPPIDELSQKLFQLGHEHEIDNEIFDIEFTPNRGDCLSLNGLARDLNIFYKSSYSIETYDKNIDELNLDFQNLSPNDCPLISFLEIEIDNDIKDYKEYIKNYFKVLGNKKTNFFTDISNFISYELGQPTHCYDRNKIGNELIFETKQCNSNFKTLIDTNILLKGTNSVFHFNDEILSLAGVMGGKSSSCSSSTRKVLVECAFFNPEAIIGKALNYNLNSDAAYKFERGIDISSQEKTLRRFIRVVEDHATIKSIKFKSFESKNPKSITLPIDEGKINKILGTKLSKDEYTNLLEELGFKISNEICVPMHRNDIHSQNDLAEEVARLIGYDNIPNSSLNLESLNNEKVNQRESKIREFLIKNNFNEVINFPFVSSEDQESIKIDNPLDSNRNNLRTSIRESLIENLLYNERRQKDSVKLFEIANIYSRRDKIVQQKRIGIIASGRRGNNYIEFSKKLDHGYLDSLLNSNLSEPTFHIEEIPRSDLVTKKKDKVFYIEININEIDEGFFSDIDFNHDTLTNFNKFRPISEFPSSIRDFSFLIEDLTKVDQIIEKLKCFEDDILKSSFMFDFYKNDDKGIVKVGWRFIFQSNTKTLSDTDINEKSHQIVKPILDIKKVSIPGMEPDA